MLLIALVAAGFLLGALVGVTAAVRLTPRIVARLPRDEQLEFARKVNRHRRTERSTA